VRCMPGGAGLRDVSLKLSEWWPWYSRIIATFGYDQAKDQFAADLLSRLLAARAGDPSKIRELVAGRPVLVFGAGPSLEENLRQLGGEQVFDRFVLITADGATSALMNIAGRAPDVVVTDLDGVIDDIIAAEKQGAVIIVHAHGDNIEQVRKFVPKFSNPIGSTQVQPRPNVYNFFGFTDGDRAVFLAAGMGAKMIVLAGMDFGLTVGKYSKQQVKSLSVKRKKLEISRELLEWLAENAQGDVKLYNVTGKGEEIKGFKNVEPRDLKKLV